VVKKEPRFVIAYFSSAVFNTPTSQPFLETSLTIVGRSLSAKAQNGKFSNSVNVLMRIMKDSTIVKANKYHLNGPAFDSAGQAPNFIDIQRYNLSPGEYILHITLSDNNDTRIKPLDIKENVSVKFRGKNLMASTIQPLESYKRSEAPGPLTKSGYDMLPYNVNYYPETSKELIFYMEAYNADTMLGRDRPFLFSYYLESADDFKKLESYGSFRKQKAAKVNPLLTKIDISKLGTGNYNLVVELRDERNVLQLEEKFFFQRLNKFVDVQALANYDNRKKVAEYFGQCNNADTLKMFVECLWPIANNLDKERVINTAVKKDPEQMKNFVIDFWERRAADTANPLKMWAKYYQSVQQVMKQFRCGKQKGYYTERGRVYLQYGPPNQRAQQPNEPNSFPYEIWQYYRVTDATNGQFFSNRKFVFVNRNLGDDCYTLIHSDMPGELNNPRWQFEVSRRNSNGLANPDNTKPAGSEYNQYNDIYTNPR
jgi:GWxTD domain-containing protein